MESLGPSCRVILVGKRCVSEIDNDEWSRAYGHLAIARGWSAIPKIQNQSAINLDIRHGE